MDTLRPGQGELNDLELAVLRQLAELMPSISELMQGLHVLSRKFTGVGCFTEFIVREGTKGPQTAPLSLDGIIEVASLSDGLGAVLFFEGDQPACLEFFAYDESWDGRHDAFAIRPMPPRAQS